MEEAAYYQTGYYLTVYIADSGCPITNQNGQQIGTSTLGHMWISIDNPYGLVQAYGFYPVKGQEIRASEGEIRTNDLTSYQTYYQKRFPISKEMYYKLQIYCENARINHTFHNYILVVHECVDFAWDVMEAADVICFPATIVSGKSFLPHENITPVEKAYDSYIRYLRCRSSWNDFREWLAN